MIKPLMSVYDAKAKAFLNPFVVANLQLAIRAFASAANMPEQEMYHNPEDFSLHHLGDFNDENGVIALKPTPVNLGLAANFKERK